MSSSGASTPPTYEEEDYDYDYSDREQPKELAGEESLASYGFGGYHPVNLGDVLDGRYRILCKLGFGGYATVWLAEAIDDGSYVSIKIMVGCYSSSQLYEHQETRIWKALQNHNPSHPGHQYIMPLEEVFIVSGPNGEHVCSVMPIMVASLSALEYTNPKFVQRGDVLKKIATQMLLGIDYIHEAQIIHVDMKPENILVEMDGMEALVRKHLATMRPHHYEPRTNKDGVTINYVSTTPINFPRLRLTKNSTVEFKLRISDFGASCSPWETKYYWTPFPLSAQLRSPEELARVRWGYKIDIWCVGLAILRLSMSRLISVARVGQTAQEQVDSFLAQFGPLPRSMLQRMDPSVKRMFFKRDNDNEVAAEDVTWTPVWQKWLERFAERLNVDEKKLVLSFLKGAFSLDPKSRPTAKELLEHEWLR